MLFRSSRWGIGQPGQGVVDLGTGAGTLARGFALRGCRVLGIDLSQEMLAEAKRLLAAGGRMFLPTGSLQDENTILDRAKSVYGSIKQLAERHIPLPSNLSEDPALLRRLLKNSRSRSHPP